MDSKRLAELIANVLDDPFTKAELLTFYKNVAERDGPQELLEAIEERLRRDFPAAANAAFGKKSDEAMEILTRVAEKLSQEYDMSKNTVMPHVKVGGYEQTGEQYICRYISYKNGENRGVQLTLFQLAADSELLATVGTYRTNAKKENFRDEKTYPFGELEQAVERYRGHLAELGAAPRS